MSVIYHSTDGVLSWEKAQAIQRRRYESGKRGMAKAVRRYLIRFHGLDYKATKGMFPIRP